MHKDRRIRTGTGGRYMRLRPYIECRDFEYLKNWITDERTHNLWCANLIPYPLTREGMRSFLEKDAADWGGSAYVATEDDGETAGFFCYSLDLTANEGFLKCIVVNDQKRGQGYGKKMLHLALRYAFTVTGAETVQLNVFEQNATAVHCYEKIGFKVRTRSENAFSYRDEMWDRSNLVIERNGYI